MRLWTIFFSLFLLCITLICPDSRVNAAPIISNVYFFTERVEWMPNGWGYQFGLTAYDDEFSRNIVSVTATEVTKGFSFDLQYDGEEWGLNPNLVEAPDLIQMEIVATNDLNETFTFLTHALIPLKLDFADNIGFSGNLISPTFYWDSVEFADVYRIRISDSSNNLVYNSLEYMSDFPETFHAVPDGFLFPDEEYVVRISASDINDGILMNRSSELFSYSTVASSPVPEPTTALMLGMGMAGFVFMLRKKR